MALYWLEHVLGDWEDAKGNRYEVTLDERSFSGTVRTIRSNGRIQTTRGMLKYNSEDDCLMWGSSYYLQVDDYDPSQVYWKPLKSVRPYTWYRVKVPEVPRESWKEVGWTEEVKAEDKQVEEKQVEEEHGEKVEVKGEGEGQSEEEGWEGWTPEFAELVELWGPGPDPGIALEEVVGSWKDDLGMKYFITQDDLSTCSATIVLKDGRTSLANEIITCRDGSVWWADSYYLFSSKPGSICWKSNSGEEFAWDSCDVAEKGHLMSSGNLQALLGQMCGKWSDEDSTSYTVTMDKSCRSCSVYTQRADGKARFSPGRVRYDLERQRVMWGKSYYLEVLGAGDVCWVHVGHGKSFRWLLCQSSGAPLKPWAQACLEEVVGQWEDQDDTLHLVTFDEAVRSCGVKTYCRDGKSRYTGNLITADPDFKRVWWGTGYYAELQYSRADELCWTPTKTSRSSFWWRRVNSC